MSPVSVPVDLCNPGQVFACLGLMEMTEAMNGPCRVRFGYAGKETQCSFEIDGPEDCVEKSVRFLARCKVVAMAPRRSVGDGILTAAKWQVETVTTESQFFPGPVPDSPATLPIRLSFHGIEIPVEHWMDDTGKTGRDNMKFWAGAGGYPGAALARDAVSLLSAVDDSALSRIARDPFAFSAAMNSSFRFDWRRDYIPLDAGFSPNDQPSVGMVGFPLVELLAAIGLQNARPSRIDPRNKLAYHYFVSNTCLPPSLARAVLGSGTTGFPVRRFRMTLGWPGKENQARCIINAEEDSQ